jgi:EpsI family protein
VRIQVKTQQTTKQRDPNLKSVIAAAIVASCLMLGHGLIYRAIADRLAAPVTTTPISPEVLGKFPMQIGDWEGQEVPLDEKIRRRTDADALINRQYVRKKGSECISFYVACGVNARDLMPHRPEVCYVGAGWTRTNRRSLELPLKDGTALPCNVIWFSRGVLDNTRIVVLDYYIVDGQYSRDVSLLRWKAARGSGTVRYVAQVQIATSITGTLTSDSAAGLISGFAIDSAPLIAGLFKDIQSAPNADTSTDCRTGSEGNGDG